MTSIYILSYSECRLAARNIDIHINCNMKKLWLCWATYSLEEKNKRELLHYDKIGGLLIWAHLYNVIHMWVLYIGMYVCRCSISVRSTRISMGYGKRLCDHRWYWAGIAGVGLGEKSDPNPRRLRNRQKRKKKPPTGCN